VHFSYLLIEPQSECDVFEKGWGTSASVYEQATCWHCCAHHHGIAIDGGSRLCLTSVNFQKLEGKALYQHKQLINTQI
jgi:hypothetical protein